MYDPIPIPRWYAVWVFGGAAVAFGLVSWTAGSELVAAVRQQMRRNRIKGARKDPQRDVSLPSLSQVALFSGLGLGLFALASLNRKYGSRGQPMSVAALGIPLLVMGAVCDATMVGKRNALRINRKRDHEESKEASAAPVAAAGAAPASSSSPAAMLLSNRVRHIIDNDSTPPQNSNHLLRIADPLTYPTYHGRSHPDGYISCAIAENKCCLPWLPYLSFRPGMGLREVGYADFNGMVHVRESLADFLGEYIFGREVNPACLLMTAGANIALDSLFFSLANPGEYVLLATPYYAAFKCTCD